MRWLFRPAVLIGLSLLLVAVAALVVLLPPAALGRPQPLAVPAGTREVAWLQPATSVTAWERFVQAARRAAAKLDPPAEVIEAGANDSSPTVVPEVVLQWSARDRIAFRWYKLTSVWTAEAWATQLLARTPAPLAVISGTNTYWAREVARQLHAHAAPLPPERRPLLLLTTATADKVAIEGRDEPTDLHQLYPGRTFRFCFTNRQMASAVTRFIWSQADLRPDADPAFLVQWTDDSYSQDLFDGYQNELNARAHDGLVLQTSLALGLRPFGLHPLMWDRVLSGFRHDGSQQFRIDSSVGGFLTPNVYEARNVRFLLQVADPERGVMPQRPLLVVTGQVGPSRRFLRDLARSDPALARQFVVASGDALSFDTIYRDRLVTWPVQDLPFDLVFFSHRNPIDGRAGFVPDTAADSTPTAASGTEMLRLYEDLVEATALASRDAATADDVRDGLKRVHFLKGRLAMRPEGVPLFDPERQGTRNNGTGEHVVVVRPTRQGQRSLPEAVIEVWRQPAGQGWSRVVALKVHYAEPEQHREQGDDHD